LARAFNVNLSSINRRINLLEGICPEAINLLQDKQFTPDFTRILRNMKSARQVEAVKLMANEAVKSYILRHEPDILEQFELVVNTVSMEEAVQLQGGQAETAAEQD
jgi:pterin-4a-carbinolamine dehydratase